MSKTIDDYTKEELYTNYIHTDANNYELRQLIKELVDNFSDEIVDKENGNYIKIKVEDLPEEIIYYE